jgi:hypothetical protein
MPSVAEFHTLQHGAFEGYDRCCRLLAKGSPGISALLQGMYYRLGHDKATHEQIGFYKTLCARLIRQMLSFAKPYDTLECFWRLRS